MNIAKTALFAALIAFSASASAACEFGSASFDEACAGSSQRDQVRMGYFAEKARIARAASADCSWGSASASACSAVDMGRIAADSSRAKERADQIRWGWIAGDI